MGWQKGKQIGLSSHRKLNIVLSERDELIVRKETTDREKSRIEIEVHEERARKTDLQVLAFPSH